MPFALMTLSRSTWGSVRKSALRHATASCSGASARRSHQLQIFKIERYSGLTLGFIVVAETAVAEGSYVRSGALLHRDMADALLVGPWVSGHFSTPSSGCRVYITVADGVVTRSRALCVAISKSRSFCGRRVARLHVGTGRAAELQRAAHPSRHGLQG